MKSFKNKRELEPHPWEARLSKIDVHAHRSRVEQARTKSVFEIIGVGTTRRLYTIIDESSSTPDRTG